jgi:hypothetical protein
VRDHSVRQVVQSTYELEAAALTGCCLSTPRLKAPLIINDPQPAGAQPQLVPPPSWAPQARVPARALHAARCCQRVPRTCCTSRCVAAAQTSGCVAHMLPAGAVPGGGPAAATTRLRPPAAVLPQHRRERALLPAAAASSAHPNGGDRVCRSGLCWSNGSVPAFRLLRRPTRGHCDSWRITSRPSGSSSTPTPVGLPAQTAAAAAAAAAVTRCHHHGSSVPLTACVPL